MLEKGQVVNIYQKPITQEDFEGKAKLIKEYRPDEGDGLSIWIVEFEDEPGQTYTRTVYDSIIINGLGQKMTRTPANFINNEEGWDD